MISVFKREFLESSSTYHSTSTTTSIPIQSLTAASKVSENLINNDKILRRNMTSILKAGLSIKMAKLNNDDHPHPTVTQKSENLMKPDNQTISYDDGIIRTAPSYTFYAPEEILSKTRFILHTSRNILEHLQNWLNVPYPFTKLDFVALPSIEENLHSSLGLILCKTAFLRDSSNITTYEYQKSAIETSEAILKQYFGGMISPKLWKQNWLWDGIIRYLSRLILAPLQPEWSIDEMYLLETKLKALDIDILQGWESVLNGTDDMGENNDFYIDKSAAILEVLNSAMGEENFRSCIGAFITTYKYQTAEPNDLWQICSKKGSSAKNIKEIMLVWTSQSGFPLLSIKKVNTTIVVEQSIFKIAEIKAVHHDASLDSEDLQETTTIATTTTLAPKDLKKKANKWIFPINYITSNKELKGSMWIDSFEGKKK
jgi:aminopeptidase N